MIMYESLKWFMVNHLIGFSETKPLKSTFRFLLPNAIGSFFVSSLALGEIILETHPKREESSIRKRLGSS